MKEETRQTMGDIPGLPIYASEFLEITSNHMKPRTIRDRLFTKPWRPFRKRKLVRHCFASSKALVVDGNYIIVHPKYFEKIKTSLARKIENGKI